MPSKRDPGYVLANINRYRWEPWLKRDNQAFILSFNQDCCDKKFMAKCGIKDITLKAMLWQKGGWYLSDDVWKEFADQLGNHFEKRSIVTLTKSLDRFYNKNKSRIKKLLEEKRPIEEKLAELLEIWTTCFSYIWISLGLENFYDRLAKKEVPKYVKGDIDKFIGDASFPTKKNCITKMEDMMRKGRSPESIAKKYGWLRIRDAYSDPYSPAEIEALMKSLKPATPHKKVHVPRQLKKLFKELQELVYFRTYRTDVMYETMFLARPILKEAAAKYDIPFEELRYYTIPSLVAGKPEKYSADITFAYIDGRFLYQDGPIIIDEQPSKADSVKGRPAYKGIVRGTVKVMNNVSEMNKVKEGDILVTIMTFPSYIPALQRAAAFVTDEGSITCHAAIVAREMRKPCIIATKIATKVFKDGDLVEVDADKGIVSLIKKTQVQQKQESAKSDSKIVNKYSLDSSTWTYKGFHGVLHTFFPVGRTGPAMQDFFNDCAHITVFFVKDDYVHWYWNDNDLDRLRNELFSRMQKDSKYFDKIVKIWNEKIKRFDQLLTLIDNVDMGRISDTELIALYDDFYKRYVDEFKCFMALGDAVSMHADRYLVPEFQKILGNDFTEFYPKLLTTSHLSFIEQESIDRYKLMSILKSKKKIPQKLLEAHSQKYYYIQNNYAKGIRLSAGDFLRLIKEDVRKKVKKPSSSRKKEISERDRLIKKYKLSRWQKTLLLLMDELFGIQDTRKKYVLISNYYQFKFLKEAEQRSKIPFSLLQSSIFPEFASILNKSINTKVLEERKKCCACIHTQKGYEVISGDEAADTLAFYLNPKQQSGEIKGMVASSGKITGRVKILLKIHDMANMEKGDILVSSMTRPEMVPAMKLAAAIITDEGGVTSHAAIVSREMKIPCIIGTKIATKVLKDGDLVEVDADKGIVKKIK